MFIGDWMERGTDSPQASPWVVVNAFDWIPAFRALREEDLLASLLSEKVVPDEYPGDSVPSPNWPNVPPGMRGPIKASSAKTVGDTVTTFLEALPKLVILWVRAADDQIVSDNAFFELGTPGQLGHVPGWPGADVYPPQPMLSQTRAVPDQYSAQAGRYNEVGVPNTGHTPSIEAPEEFGALLEAHFGRCW